MYEVSGKAPGVIFTVVFVDVEAVFFAAVIFAEEFLVTVFFEEVSFFSVFFFFPNIFSFLIIT